MGIKGRLDISKGAGTNIEAENPARRQTLASEISSDQEEIVR